MTRILIIAAALVIVVGVAYAQTDVTEDISTNTTWNFAGSPYTLQGNIDVTSWSILTIDPGVIVKFDSGAKLKTDAGCSIVADGTVGNQILFTSNSGTPAPYDWYAVHLRESPASSFTHCTFEYAQFNLYIDQCDPTISHCTSRSSMYGITCEGASPQIEGCDITQNMHGIVIYGPDSDPVVHNCNLYDNPAGNMYVSAYPDPPMVTIDAENNWWGTDVDTEIGNSIMIHGLSIYVQVDYDPWLHEVPVEASSWGRVKALFVR